MSPITLRFIVDAALSVLGAASALSWIVILQKAFASWRRASQNRRFDSAWGDALRHTSFACMPIVPSDAKGPKARIARVAMAAISLGVRFDETGHSPLPDAVLAMRKAQLERVLSQQIQRERRMQEAGLTVLASVANVAPFVGLFGTVFGIIHALHGLATDGAGGVEAIAGPVGDALIATGLGIAVAIPAVLAYNAFGHRTRTSTEELHEFGDELVEAAEHNRFRIHGYDGADAVRQPVVPVNAFSAREAAA